MEKIQQLLNYHKDKLWYPELSISTQDWWFKVYKHRNHRNQLNHRSLSEILFNTPFLSWLEWDTEWISVAVRERSYNWDCEIDYWWSDTEYHKINLALLSTDKERIKYVEQFVL